MYLGRKVLLRGGAVGDVGVVAVEKPREDKEVRWSSSA